MGYELKELRLVATTVLYNPQNNVIDNIKSYIEYVEKIIIVDNSIENNIELIYVRQKEVMMMSAIFISFIIIIDKFNKNNYKRE